MPRWALGIGTDKATRLQIRATWHQPCRSTSQLEECCRMPNTDKRQGTNYAAACRSVRNAAAFLTPRWAPGVRTDKAIRNQIRATWHGPCRSMTQLEECGRIPSKDKSYMTAAVSQEVATWGMRPHSIITRDWPCHCTKSALHCDEWVCSGSRAGFSIDLKKWRYILPPNVWRTIKSQLKDLLKKMCTKTSM